MPRAVYAAFLSLPILAFGLSAAQADPSRFVGYGVARSPMTALRPVPGALPTVGYKRHERLPPAQFYTQPVWREEGPAAVPPRQAPAARPIEPLSVSPVDPGSIVSLTASGRVAIAPPPGFYGYPPEAALLAAAQERPYAPPAFHMIGAPSARNMASPVRLTYGVKPPESFKPGPKVVWLDGSDGRGFDDAGGRIKRLR